MKLLESFIFVTCGFLQVARYIVIYRWLFIFNSILKYKKKIIRGQIRWICRVAKYWQLIDHHGVMLLPFMNLRQRQFCIKCIFGNTALLSDYSDLVFFIYRERLMINKAFKNTKMYSL